MKTLILIIATLSFGLVFSQKTKSQKQSEKPESKIPINPYRKSDSTNSNEIKKENNSIAFYKNVDSATASKYKMLNKKPDKPYSELPKNKELSESK